ncbi:HNH endonuclease [Streptomyces mirabilis]
MVLTAHRGLCVYCGRSRAATLEHEKPIADRGADIWWNFVPSCMDCNRWKNGRSAKKWVRDMDLHHRYPEVGFAKRAMRPEVYAGITRRVERAQREIADPDRRDWFRHHYGLEKHRNKTEMFEVLGRCREELKGYPHYPWRTPKVRDTRLGFCVRLICCGYMHPDARSMHAILSAEEYLAFRQAAYRERVHVGELLGKIVRQYLTEGAERPEGEGAEQERRLVIPPRQMRSAGRN